MPFDFLRRRKPAGAPTGAAEAAGRPAKGIAFDGFTEEWRLVGRMEIDDRLSDALNKREPITIGDVSWQPLDGSGPLVPVPGLRSVDPYDLILVMAGQETLPDLSDDERAAHRVHKIAYDVALEVPPFRVIGTVHLHPGSEPDRLLERSTEMFVAVTDAVAMYGERRLGEAETDALLVNRRYLRGVEQVDKRTGAPHQKLPGSPLGGVSWQDRSR